MELTGKLTIHGVTRNVAIPVRINGTSYVPGVGTLASFETDFTVDRTDYGVNGLRCSAGQLAIGNRVNIHIALGCVGPVAWSSSAKTAARAQSPVERSGCSSPAPRLRRAMREPYHLA